MNKLLQILLSLIIISLSPNLLGAAADEVKTDSDDFETTIVEDEIYDPLEGCLLYTSPSPRDRQKSRMPSSA